jgi:hypothetical protein
MTKCLKNGIFSKSLPIGPAGQASFRIAGLYGQVNPTAFVNTSRLIGSNPDARMKASLDC